MASQTRLNFVATLGDYSDDGHGKTKSFSIEIVADPGVRLTDKRIRKNYEANAEKLGFGIGNLWEDYEQYSPSMDHIKAIQEKLGAKLYAFLAEDGVTSSDLAEVEDEYGISFEGVYDGESDLPSDSFILNVYNFETAFEGGDGGYGAELKLVMFVILSGLEGVSWHEIPNRKLFGDFDSTLKLSSHVGYGLFS